MATKGDPIIVEFPLRGEWAAVHTPAERVPGHGTDFLGQRYAFDFCRYRPDINLPYGRGVEWRHLFATVPPEEFLCWNDPVFSAFDGEVIATRSDWHDRSRINLVWELVRSSLFPPQHRSGDATPLLGNFVFVRGDRAIAVYAHLRKDSIRVRPGQTLHAGEEIGTVGNSGNSTMPHLHFQLMDDADAFRASGLYCAFRRYESFSDGEWKDVTDGVPQLFERVRA